MRRRLLVLVTVTAILAALTPGAGATGAPPVATSDSVVTVQLQPAGKGTMMSVPLRVARFSMLGAELADDTEADVRVRADDGVWRDWMPLEHLVHHSTGPDAGSVEDGDGRWRAFSEPLWTGSASWVQVRAEGQADSVRLHLIDALGESQGVASRATTALRSLLASPAHAATRPDMISRSEWGANESWRGPPSYMRRVRAGVLHHTVSSNTYSRDEAKAVVRGIYHYHTRTLGWSDIGYHFLVDRFGRVYVGRAGGADRAVLGAHAGGFNTDTFGIALMGNFDQTAPSYDAQRAVVATRAWKMAHHGINPRGRVTLTSAGSSRYDSGRRVRLPTFFGHRDVSSTACPGAKAYALLGDMPTRIPPPRRPLASRSSRPAPRGPFPVFGDWDGDGIDTPGWWRAGRVSIRLTNTSGPADHRFRYGRRGDVPVVGDWNDDGRDTIGVVRGGTWLLRDRLSAGPSQRRVRFGQAGDWPVVGDWDGNGRDGIGMVRGSLWLLRPRPSGGPAQLAFRYGAATDWPVVGDWDGDGRATPGLVRATRWYQRADVARGPSSLTRFGGRDARPVVGRALPLGAANLVRVSNGTWSIRHRDGLVTQTIHFPR